MKADFELPIPDSTTIDLWITQDTQIVDPDLINAYHQFLSPEESQQQQRFHFEKHRHQYLITRALVRSTLSKYCPHITPKDWLFKKNDYGKPYVTNPGCEHLFFNISHTEDMVVLAVSPAHDLGVDVEWLSRDNDILSIQDRFFSKAEVAQLKLQNEEDRKRRFFDLWTLKEAYIKACGKGLSIPLDCFSYLFDEFGNIRLEFASHYKDEPEYWDFWRIQPNDSHKIAIALKKPDLSAHYRIKIRGTIPLKQSKAVEMRVTYRR